MSNENKQPTQRAAQVGVIVKDLIETLMIWNGQASAGLDVNFLAGLRDELTVILAAPTPTVAADAAAPGEKCAHDYVRSDNVCIECGARSRTMSNENKQHAVQEEIVLAVQAYGDARADGGDSAAAIANVIRLLRATQQATTGDERADALQDMAFVNGVQTGYKFGLVEDHAAYEKCIASRDGYLKVLRETRATPSTVAGSAGQAPIYQVTFESASESERRIVYAAPTAPSLPQESAGQAPIYQNKLKRADSWCDCDKATFDHTSKHPQRFDVRVLYAAPTAPSLTTDLTADAGAVTDLAQRCRELIELAEIGESKQEALRALADTYHRDITPHDRRAMAISQTHLEAMCALLAAHPEQRMSAAREEQPSWTNPMTPYGMLVRALRIVVGTTLMDMATFLGCGPAQLSALEFGRKPVTNADIVNAAHYFASFGINSTTHALTMAARKAEIERQGGEA